ncbi:hypothetical protein H9L15_08490 [Sphingomonas daechungensis]|uniref:Uncharacterized protein n=1 Tax=Sphingomonas daechungensis TaxID=1176646 RepID=A0ABX6SYT7_9SPHN|nr:hypothetical protein [Sphingomonas daechungensis]QNP42359.1 hypothetical protein H9L15_08490 [Sphingomonas daechungensis]
MNVPCQPPPRFTGEVPQEIHFNDPDAVEAKPPDAETDGVFQRNQVEHWLPFPREARIPCKGEEVPLALLVRREVSEECFDETVECRSPDVLVAPELSPLGRS